MPSYKITKGLDLPITGDPDQSVLDNKSVTTVALTAADYIGMKPKMFVKVGDPVKRGQPIFEDRKTPGVIYTAPGAGTITGVHRGAKRALISVTVELNEAERSNQATEDDFHRFENFTGEEVEKMKGDAIAKLLIESGTWTAFRTRPFSRIPEPGTTPEAIFVTAMDTHPLSPSVEKSLENRKDAFVRGLKAISKLTQGKTYLCTAPNEQIPSEGTNVQKEDFSGKHPAGTPGLHIHTLRPVGRQKTVWHIGYQDVVNIGRLFKDGKLDVERIISLAGPPVTRPRLLRTRLGASIDQLCHQESTAPSIRTISGSVLGGRIATGDTAGFLGRYHNQITLMVEDQGREFMGWLKPGGDRFSVIPTFVSALIPGKKFNFTTTSNGSHRGIVPIGAYEKVMPMDILPTFLLRSLCTGDLERAEELGCLELDEEDLALCTFVCPGKNEYGTMLRNILTQIQKEG